MATSTPRSDRPDLARVPLVSAVVADRRPLPALPRPAGPYRRAWWRFRRDRLAMGALALFALLAVVSFLGPLVIAIDPYQQDLRSSLLAPGDAGHLLGTDNFGRDVLLRLVDGGRVSMTVGLAAVTVSLAIGGLIGLVAGYFGGWTDRILMRIIDVKLAFPGILLALVIVTVLGSGLEKVMIAVGIGGIPRFARVVRALVDASLDEQHPGIVRPALEETMAFLLGLVKLADDQEPARELLVHLPVVRLELENSPGIGHCIRQSAPPHPHCNPLVIGFRVAGVGLAPTLEVRFRFGKPVRAEIAQGQFFRDGGILGMTLGNPKK